MRKNHWITLACQVREIVPMCFEALVKCIKAMEDDDIEIEENKRRQK